MRLTPANAADRKVLVTEVGTRDGFQAEPAFIPTPTKVEILDALIDAGVASFEATSFVSPRAVPQMADAVQVMAQVERRKGVRLQALVPNARGAEAAAAARVDMMVCFVSASESHNQTNLNKPIGASLENVAEVAAIGRAAGIPLRGAVATAFGCPFEGEVPIESVLRIVEAYAGLGVRHISLGDTTGMATPRLVDAGVAAIRSRFPELEIALHFHNTRGIGLANVLAGLELGIREFESSIGGIGGCPFAPGATGNICTEDLVYLLHECGFETGIDLERAIRVARRVEEVVGHPLPGQVMRAGPRLRHHAVESVRRAVG
ncbi:MAG: hydroxymethylglutaryl-CoA lyase [Betaproteobacteria bacterium]|jgi:hydroxymethylglutaryl-CoA lyase|nr:hydroxymethylglutaryl-CoA lyase [Betaproteobacteria bacterium]